MNTEWEDKIGLLCALAVLALLSILVGITIGCAISESSYHRNIKKYDGVVYFDENKYFCREYN